VNHCRTTILRLAALAVVAVPIAACSDPSAGGVAVQESNLPCAEGENDAMRLRLAPTCIACHDAGATRPFFANVIAFEDLLVYDTRYVVPGDPDASVLVALLEGTSTGAFAQMPPIGDAFAAQAGRGETDVTMDEIREWIRTLPPAPARTSGPDLAAATTRRLRADEVIKAMQVALGQEPSGGHPPLLAVDGTRPEAADAPVTASSYGRGERVQMYLMLGGPSYLRLRPPEETWTPSSLITLSQIAQGACSAAVDASAPALFEHATPASRLAADEPAIRANIAYLYERFLEVEPDEAAVEEMLTRVYAPAEAIEPRSAWVQVCTHLVRHPLFITF
jgi:hypothetical protein